MKIPHRSIALAATLVAALVLACSDSPTGPGKDRFAIAVGDSVEGSYAPGDTTIYRISLRAGETIALHFWALDDPLVATLSDSTGVLYTVSRGSSLGGPFGQWTPITVPRSGTYRVRVGLITGSKGGRFALRPVEVPTAPEKLAAAFQTGDTVSGESLDQPDDVDDFTVDLSAGQRIEIYFQSLGSSSPQPEALFAADSAGVGVQAAAVIAPATSAEDLESRAVALSITKSGRYHLRVQNAYVVSTGEYVGPYRFMLYVIDARPESASATIVPGDTVAESIDHVGDVDTFTLTAPAGKEFNLFAESDGAAPHAVGATLFGDDSATVGARAVVLAPLGTPLLDHASGRFTMPASGTMRVVINDARNTGGVYRGPYRLFVYPIDSAPEGRSADFVADGTPVSGAIEMLGDIDVYNFTLDSTRELAVRTDWPSDYSTTLKYQVYGANGTVPDLYSVPPGTYHVRVQPVGTGQTGGFRGNYAFAIAPVLRSPERAPPTLVVNDTVSAETIAWPVDVDTFHFAPPMGDTVVFELMRPPGDTSWARNLTLADASTGASVGVTSLWDGDRLQLPRVVVTPGQTVRATVFGSTTRWAPGTEGAFKLVARRVSAAPEHSMADIAVDDTVRDSLDYYGDIDDYVLHGTPGQNIEMQLSPPPGYSPRGYTIAVFDPSTDSLFSDNQTWASRHWIATRVPASGELRVRVCVGQGCILTQCDAWDCTVPPHPLGPYWFIAHVVDPSPETRPAAFALGDTVSESIATEYDVDQYTFSGSAGDRVNVAFRWLQAAPEIWRAGLGLELIDPVSETPIATLISDGKAAPLGDVSSTVTLPRTGSYVVRIYSRVDPQSEIADGGDYRFVVTAAP